MSVVERGCGGSSGGGGECQSKQFAARDNLRRTGFGSSCNGGSSCRRSGRAFGLHDGSAASVLTAQVAPLPPLIIIRQPASMQHELMLSPAMLVRESLPHPLARPLAQSSAAIRHRHTENAGSLHHFSYFHPHWYLSPHIQSPQPLSIRHHFLRSRGNSHWRQRVERSG